MANVPKFSMGQTLYQCVGGQLWRTMKVDDAGVGSIFIGPGEFQGGANIRYKCWDQFNFLDENGEPTFFSYEYEVDLQDTNVCS